jgi:hypothetical protein
MTSLLDGTLIDLDRVQVASDGSRWLWTFEHTDASQPLMLRIDERGQRTAPLDWVVRWHGALTPQPQPTTAAMYRQVLEASNA